MDLFLGIIIGILLCILFFILDLTYRRKVFKNGPIEHLKAATKEKGDILEPTDTELLDWVDNLKEE